MEVYRRSSWLVLLVLELLLFFITLKGAYGELDIQEGPSESQCRPYIEKALKQLETGDTASPSQDDGDSKEDIPTIEITNDESEQPTGYEENENDGSNNDSAESTEIGEPEQEQVEDESSEREDESKEDNTENDTQNDKSEEQLASDEIMGIQELTLDQILAPEPDPEVIRVERSLASESEPEIAQGTVTESIDSQEVNTLDEKDAEQDESEAHKEDILEFEPNKQENEDIENDNEPTISEGDDISSKENGLFLKETVEELGAAVESVTDDNSKESRDTENEIIVEQSEEKLEDTIEIVPQDSEESSSKEGIIANEDKHSNDSLEDEDEKVGKTEAIDTDLYNTPIVVLQTHVTENEDDNHGDSKQDTDSEKDEPIKDSVQDTSSEKVVAVEKEKLESINLPSSKEEKEESNNSNEPESKESDEGLLVEELTEGSEEDTLELRPRNHIAQLLKLDEDSSSNSKAIGRTSEIILKDLKKLYESAIKPLEILYKYKDLSNRHFGDPEIFAKPLILFMGPWSGGKSSIINYLLGIEYSDDALHTGAEPSPAYFNILTYGEEAEVLDGIQLAADYTFSGLQKFGQGLEERLRGYKLPNKLLEKVNIVEIPGILEVRKQVSRVFPFNDACQWFIDRADIIFLVYDPSKLDVGPETEAILDQLKGREHQTRIVLNKADQVKPEELMRVQGALIWNISPLMSSAQPPIMYTTSLWSRPYETWAPVRLLQAQERAFLRDIRTAVDKRIDNKIASARRFAVRVRNHAKMVDCYLTTYYNHKSVFGNRKQISDEIINHPQDFHIYEGLSTLTNISRYDLPDPEVYRDFFRLNALYDFQQLSSTCTYFRGCPINRLDIAIAYDLPELVGKHKKLIETTINETHKAST